MTQKKSADPWLEEPVITALSDAPVKSDTFLKDSFGLGRTMGPVYDILRHGKKQMPLSIGIYGGWGAGKSTAMHWLQDRLAHWTENGPDGHVNVYTTWFYPWKYDTKEDVWRGLIAEVLLACVNEIEGTSSETWAKMAKDFGRFLGKSFVHVLSSVKLKGGPAEISMAELVKVMDEAADFIEPSKAYLNQFETVLESAVRDTLGNPEGDDEPPKNRLVVFIDDLDRCLPQVALQVLEALKLYLNIPDLVFVLGVDDRVINDLVVKHYDDLGLTKDKSQQYLAKMFQVEVHIAPLEQKMSEFLKQEIEANESWKRLDLDDDATGVFTDAILALAGDVPREIKRLVNYCLMAGRGVQFVPDEEDDITAQEAIQFYLLYKALDRDGKRSMLTTNAGQKIFYDASNKSSEETSRFPRRRNFPPNPASDGVESEDDKTSELLNDTAIRHLLKLPFPHPDRLGGLTQTLKPSDDNIALIEAIEKEMDGVKWGDATDEDFAKVTELNVSYTDTVDISPLTKLTNLESLYLNGTQTANFRPIQNLARLKTLAIGSWKRSDNPISDIRDLSGLTNLESLTIIGANLKDLEDLRALTGLTYLNISGTKAQNYDAITALHSLERLDISRTKISNADLFKNLSKLRVLRANQINLSNLNSLSKSKNLKELSNTNSSLSDLSDIQRFSGLTWLDIRHTSVADLSGIEKLPLLDSLLLEGTPVTDITLLENLSNLELLDLEYTDVSNIDVVANLSDLDSLYLRGTNITDFSPLLDLEYLSDIYLPDTDEAKEIGEQLEMNNPHITIEYE